MRISEVASAATELLTPWYLSPGGLNTNEQDELARRRAMKPTVSGTRKVSLISSTQPKEANMAGEAIISGAKRAFDLVRKNPGVAKKVAEYYRKATGKAVDFTKSSATDILHRGPAPAAVFLRGAVTAGINPDDIFEKDILVGQRDGATAQIITDLRTLYGALASRLDASAVIHSSGGLAERLLNKEVILFAQQKFGSPSAIREAHAKFRMFLAMDSQVLEETIALHLGR